MNCCEHNHNGHRHEKASREKGDVYICPMHPEVVKENPGMCPECGMRLVAASRKHADKNADLRRNKTGTHKGHSTNIFKVKFWVSFLLTIPVILYSELATDVLGIHLPEFPGSMWLGPVLGSIVFFYGGWIFLKSAWVEIRGKMPGMMTLISLAIVTAYLYSMTVVLFGFGESVLFWELTSLITIMLLGHWLEMRAVAGAKGALRELSKLLPDEAEIILTNSNLKQIQTSNIQTKTVPVSELEEGNIVLVRPGGKIPADGTVIEGMSAVNESVITGESKLVEKKGGDGVVAGTTNGDGSLKIKVDKIGEKTFLSGVMRLVEEAERSKSKLQMLSDRAALYLTGIAVSVGLATLVTWLLVGAGASTAVTRLVAVLIIACPHALGLAVPLVASISTTKAAKNGLLVKKRLALESAREIDTVLLDKTGTLTKGEFGVEKVVAGDNFSREEILKLSASVNSHSEHPIAKAIVKEAQKSGINLHEISNYERIAGKGAKAKLSDTEVVVGSDRLLKEYNLKVSGENKRMIEELARKGSTVNHVIVDGKYGGSLALTDIIREESKEAIQEFKQAGIKTAMVTGDTEDVARHVAQELGIDEYFAQVLPEQKSNIVKKLQEKGEKVAMVGDGVNDAPALTQADLGIAIGAGTNVAIESAGIILVRDDPRDITKIFKLSKMTYRKMIQNLWWAAGYNIIAIPLAAGIFVWAGIVLEPAVGAVLMSASTVIVAFNALLLKKAAL